MSGNAADGSKAEQLTHERAVNEQYVRLMEKRSSQPLAGAVAPRNSIWVGQAPRMQLSPSLVQPLYGRVALDHRDDLLGTDFYIGTYYEDVGDAVVISWAAPKADLFFDGRAAHDELAASVRGRRSFVRQDLDIVDYTDDVEPGVERAALFSAAVASTLEVPTAPAIVRPRPAPVAPEPEPARDVPRPEDGGAEPVGAESTEESDEKAATGESAVSVVEEIAPPAVAHGLRAEEAVLAVLEQPRTGHLGSVLATLQPDQYRLVTWPSDEPLVVQGQPGTGKTIIATHRAAYLTHPAREPAPLARVLLVGPTDQHRDHVKGAIQELGAPNVEIASIGGILLTLAGGSQAKKGPAPEPEEWVDTMWDLGRIVQRAVARARAADRLSRVPRQDLRRLADALFSDSALHRLVLQDRDDTAEVSRRLLSFRSYDEAIKKQVALPLLATIGLEVGMLSSRERFSHVIVDEAQDVRPLEWRVLDRLLLEGGAFSIFGDTNQRRSDWSYASWYELLGAIEAHPEPESFAPEELTVGYRSTRQILRFANQLLPSAQRKVHALRDGAEPVVVKEPAVRRDEAVVKEAEVRARRFAPGLVAIISMGIQPIADRFRRAGWSRGSVQHSWSKDGATVVVLHPEGARGLEFDAVIVVEPDDFPSNVGREGLLFTSLTRATKELVVVHSRALPKNLRPHRR